MQTRFLEVTLNTSAYDPEIALELVFAAKGLLGESWPDRCLAVLLLETQLLRAPLDCLPEFETILGQLGVKIGNAALSDVVAQLIQKCKRLNRRIRTRSGELGYHLPYFLRCAHDVSKLTLARYAFSPREVVERILQSVAVSEGTQDARSRLDAYTATRWTAAPTELPEYEAEILELLCAESNIYWVSERCGSEINALVEYPLTSAVLVIKPPGSDIEFEIKRAGTRGQRLLRVITDRKGREAPQSHRLFGGSLGWLAKRETSSAELFSKIHRLVHGTECPCSRTYLNSSVVSVPTASGVSHILDYLTDETEFGEGFQETRDAMRDCVRRFPSDTAIAQASYPGESGLTLQFIGQALPQQAVLFGSSAFRLDRLAVYLSDSGPDEYFRVGLGREYSDWEARWFADSILEEILGSITPPVEGFLNFSEYVSDLLRTPENRARADANYLSIMKQMGECWGTLLAVRGFSDGESFVQRNVGLKSVWKDGDWRIRVIFMDHDDLSIAGQRYRHSWPLREAPGMLRDQVHLIGGLLGDELIPGDVSVLQRIYRIDAATGDLGIGLLEQELKSAYGKTQFHLADNPELQNLFYPEFVDRFADFDSIVSGYLHAEPSNREQWKNDSTAFLRQRGYSDELVAECIEAVHRSRDFFERMRFLYCK